MKTDIMVWIFEMDNGCFAGIDVPMRMVRIKAKDGSGEIYLDVKVDMRKLKSFLKNNKHIRKLVRIV